MVRFRDISIRRKLLLINMLTTSTALVLASTAFISYERQRFQQDLESELSSLSRVFSAAAAPALETGEKAAAEEVLSALASDSRILGACLYKKDGGALRAAVRSTPGMAGDCFPGRFSHETARLEASRSASKAACLLKRCGERPRWSAWPWPAASSSR